MRNYKMHLTNGSHVRVQAAPIPGKTDTELAFRALMTKAPRLCGYVVRVECR